MYLRPQVRGQRVGAQLFDACLAFCRQQAALAMVSTRAKTWGRDRLYERRGFVATTTKRRGARCCAAIDSICSAPERGRGARAR